MSQIGPGFRREIGLKMGGASRVETPVNECHCAHEDRSTSARFHSLRKRRSPLSSPRYRTLAGMTAEGYRDWLRIAAATALDH